MIKKSKIFSLPLCLLPIKKSNLSLGETKSVPDPVLGTSKPQSPGEKSVSVETLSISLLERQRGNLSDDQNFISCYTNMYVQIGTEYFLCVVNTAVSVAVVLLLPVGCLRFSAIVVCASPL